VRGHLPETAQVYLDRAFSGDALAARRLMLMAPRRMRGHIAFLAYQAKIGNPAYREIVKAVWAPESRHLLTAFWRPQVIRRMLARAEFRIPALSDPVTVYRPFSRQHGRKTAEELSWSLSREAAIAAASRSQPGAPEILEATVNPVDIIYWGESHGEPEVVSRVPVRDAAVVKPQKRFRVPSAIGKAVGADFPATSHHR
jgi:hypothetical protein